MSRRICARLYQAIVALRPAWHDDADEHGTIKVVMTGSAADDLLMQPHIRNKPHRPRHRETLQGRCRSAQARHRTRYVADRLRRAVAPHDVRRQADEGPQPRSGDRARQSRLQDEKPAGSWSTTSASPTISSALSRRTSTPAVAETPSFPSRTRLPCSSATTKSCERCSTNSRTRAISTEIQPRRCWGSTKEPITSSGSRTGSRGTCDRAQALQRRFRSRRRRTMPADRR